MRETRTSGSEGGGTETNRSFLPLSSLSINVSRWRGNRQDAKVAKFDFVEAGSSVE